MSIKGRDLVAVKEAPRVAEYLLAYYRQMTAAPKAKDKK